jgi:hypothetical protein
VLTSQLTAYMVLALGKTVLKFTHSKGYAPLESVSSVLVLTVTCSLFLLLKIFP